MQQSLANTKVENYDSRMEWINKAAEKNNADAQYFLGSMYQSGEGVAKDKRKALEWLNKSAQQGNKKAIEELKNY